MAQSAEVTSHWHQSVEGLSTSTLEFYTSVEQALRSKEVPDLRIERIIAHEHGLLSAKREYLSVRYGRFSFDICGAPFGKDFFFSWWLVKRTPSISALWSLAALVALPLVVLAVIGAMGFFKGVTVVLVASIASVLMARAVFSDGWAAIEDALLAMPVVGLIYGRFVRPVTYYSEDTRLMFEVTVHRVVVLIVEGILTLNKLPQIPPENLKAQSRPVIE